MPTTGSDPFHRTIAGADVYLGVMEAGKVPAGQGMAQPPRDKGYYHINISLIDGRTHAPITDAQVKVSVSDGVGGETRPLDLVAANQSVSYGAYFRMPNKNPYTIAAQIQRPGVAGTSEVRFDYRAR